MTLELHEPSLEVLDGLAGFEALCLFIAEDDRPLASVAGFVDWRLCGGLSRLLKDGFFTGAKGDQVLMPTAGRLPVPRLFAVGLGREKDLDRARLGDAFTHAAGMLQKALVTSVVLAVPTGGSLDDDARSAVLKERFVPAWGRGKVAIVAERGVKTLLGA